MVMTMMQWLDETLSTGNPELLYRDPIPKDTFSANPRSGNDDLEGRELTTTLSEGTSIAEAHEWEDHPGATLMGSIYIDIDIDIDI